MGVVRAAKSSSPSQSLLLWGITIAGMLLASWAATYLLGGTGQVPPHWFYVPILVAARRFRGIVVLLTAVVAGVLAGPLVPADVKTGGAQPASDWVTRGVFFIALGLFVHGLFGRLQRAHEQERQDASRLRVLDQDRVRMITAVSHEVRTPLTAIMGFSETLESFGSSLPPDEVATIGGRLNANAARLFELLAGLLEVDASRRPDVAPNRGPVELAALVRAVLARSDLSGRPLTLELNPTTAEVDQDQIERVVEILLSNAVQHTEDGVAIWIRVGREEGGAFLEVSDSGSGVPEAFRQRIFEPFTQGPSLSPHSPGAGLGLAVAKRLVEANGGTLSVDNRIGGGARFGVRFPTVAPPS